MYANKRLGSSSPVRKFVRNRLQAALHHAMDWRLFLCYGYYMKNLAFGKFTISESSPTLIIAEFSDGHQGSIKHAKQLIDAAAASGADVVKFQMHLPEVEMTKGVVVWAGDLQDILKKSWLSPEGHAKMIDYCKEVGVQYLCTPFSPAATDVLEQLGVDGFKTGSGEVCHLPHHRKLAKISAKTGKPVFVSTGMSTMEEIAETVSIYTEEGGHPVLMNCTSEYPVKDYSHMRLGLVSRLRKQFNVFTGHSDHSLDALTTYIAVGLQGAKVIEKHFTLDRNGTFPDDSMSQDPAMMKELIDNVRKLEKDPEYISKLIRGRELDALKTLSVSEKVVTVEEQIIREWAFHSVVSSSNLKKGEALSLTNVRPARPGWGIPARYLDERYSHELLGKKVNKAIPTDQVVYWRDLV